MRLKSIPERTHDLTGGTSAYPPPPPPLGDFMSFGNNSLKSYLAMCSFSVSGRKREFVARAFIAAEQKTPIVFFATEQEAKQKQDYVAMLKEKGFGDANWTDGKDKSTVITKWLAITAGNMFEYILRVKDFDYEYIGKYKDQKACAYFDGQRSQNLRTTT